VITASFIPDAAERPRLLADDHPAMVALTAAAVMFVALPALAQQITGTPPGSPSATTTLSGERIPAPPQKFRGVINESAKDSKPWWPLWLSVSGRRCSGAALKSYFN
jgi:hypothetical protein